MINSKPVVQQHMLVAVNLPMIQSDTHLSNFSDTRKSSRVDESYKISKTKIICQPHKDYA